MAYLRAPHSFGSLWIIDWTAASMASHSGRICTFFRLIGPNSPLPPPCARITTAA